MAVKSMIDTEDPPKLLTHTLSLLGWTAICFGVTPTGISATQLMPDPDADLTVRKIHHQAVPRL